MIRIKKAAKMWLRVLSMVLALLLLCSSSVLAADMDDVPYYSYCYWEGPSRYTAVPMRNMFEATTQITGDSLGLYQLQQEAQNGVSNTMNFGADDPISLKDAEHVYLSYDQTELYILDSGNSRILIVDTDTLALKDIINAWSLRGTEYGVSATQTVTVQPNTEYTLIWQTKRMAGNNAYELKVTDADGNDVEIVDGSTVFDQPMPADATQIMWERKRVKLNSGDATELTLTFTPADDEDGLFIVDEVTMTVTGEETSILQNGDFEDGTNGWELGVGASTSADSYSNSGRSSLQLTNSMGFIGANGLYVAQDGRVFIADTENRRVLVTSRQVGEDGTTSWAVPQMIKKPEGVEIPKDLDFTPSRMTMDNKGYLYVVCQGCYYGMLVYDEEFQFKGFHGAYNVEQTVLENLKSWITGLFMTNEKNEISQKKLPAEILDIAIDRDGMLYTLSDMATGQIKRLGLSGSQTLNHNSAFNSQSGDLINFSEQPKEYWHKHYQYMANLAGLAVDPEGFIYSFDSERGRIYMYDEECRLLSVFSTGFSQGNQVGTYQTAFAMAAGTDKLFVLDFSLGQVTVYEITEYGKLYKEADTHTINGEYTLAKDKWHQVLQMDANNQRAYEGLAKAYLAEDDYQNAMKYAELGNDQETYAQAFSEVQKDWLSKNFVWIFLVCLLAVGAIAAILVISKKRKIFTIKNDKLRAALSVPFHPFQAFQSIKIQRNGSVLLASIFVVIFYLASVAEDLYGGFMYVIVDKANYNALYTLIGSVGVLMLWVIVNWGICMLNDGKGSLKDVFSMSAYSMTPMIVFSLIFTVGSHLLPATSTGTFDMLGTIMGIYTILLLLIGMTVIHEYSFFKAMGMAVITVLCMLLAAFVVFSVVLLSQQFVTFIVNIVTELILR